MSRTTSEIILTEIHDNGSLGLRDGFLRDLCARRAVPLSAGVAYASAVIALQGRLLTEADAAKLSELAGDIDEPDISALEDSQGRISPGTAIGYQAADRRELARQAEHFEVAARRAGVS